MQEMTNVTEMTQNNSDEKKGIDNMVENFFLKFNRECKPIYFKNYQGFDYISIFENFKSAQKISFFKFNIILFLVLMTSTNIFDFLFELGYGFKVIRSFLRIFVMISFVNLFLLQINIFLPIY